MSDFRFWGIYDAVRYFCWAAARLNQIPVIFSEDFRAGAVFEGVRYVNPFAQGFQLQDWI
jgi:predicted nucleic acid-binding protein